MGQLLKTSRIHFNSFPLRDGFWIADTLFFLCPETVLVVGHWEQRQSGEAACAWSLQVPFSRQLEQQQWALCRALSAAGLLCTFRAVSVLTSMLMEHFWQIPCSGLTWLPKPTLPALSVWSFLPISNLINSQEKIKYLQNLVSSLSYFLLPLFCVSLSAPF